MELYVGFSLFYNKRTFAEKFLEILCPKGPKDPKGPLTIENYGWLKYFNYGLMGKIYYYEVSRKIGGGKRCEDLKKFTENILKKPGEGEPFEDETKTVENMVRVFKQCSYETKSL